MKRNPVLLQSLRRASDRTAQPASDRVRDRHPEHVLDGPPRQKPCVESSRPVTKSTEISSHSRGARADRVLQFLGESQPCPGKRACVGTRLATAQEGLARSSPPSGVRIEAPVCTGTPESRIGKLCSDADCPCRERSGPIETFQGLRMRARKVRSRALTLRQAVEGVRPSGGTTRAHRRMRCCCGCQRRRSHPCYEAAGGGATTRRRRGTRSVEREKNTAGQGWTRIPGPGRGAVRAPVPGFSRVFPCMIRPQVIVRGLRRELKAGERIEYAQPRKRCRR